MRGKKAKQIKNEIYGDYSPRLRIYRRDENGTVRNIGLRRQYLAAKKAAN